MRHEAEESPTRGGGSQLRLSSVEGMLQDIENSVDTREEVSPEDSDAQKSSASSTTTV